MAGASRRGTAGHEERGGGQETSSPSRTFAAGDRVAGAPEEGAASHEELGGGRTFHHGHPHGHCASPSSGTLRLRGEVAI
ncbi:UNVERIFIED_CONTAM: hypothetical protein FKN15_036699 [Acipenser sinensis]